MKVFLTGATGFIGGHVTRKLRERGDEVRALVRNPEKGRALGELGCELLPGELADQSAIESGVEGCDAVIHAAAIYEVGIPSSHRERMYEANVRGTERVLGAALAAGTPRVVYVSTVAAIGNTEGEIVDETYVHRENYTSYYEETKHLAHKLARKLIDEQGLPCVIVQPGGVYGPGDHSQIGNLIEQFVKGRMPMLMLADAGFNLVHVEDVADGILLALDRGAPGEQYVLGGEIARMRDLIAKVAEISGRKAPTKTLPTGLLKLSAPLGPIIGPVLGFPPNLRELISSADGVTYWARHDKAMRELGYSPRPLDQGLRETLSAEGWLGPREREQAAA